MNSTINEIWIIHKDYQNYEVSNLGRYRKIDDPDKIMIGCLSQKSKYRSCTVNGISMTVHKFILSAYETINPSLEIDHIDHNSLNNSISNLTQITLQENRKRSLRDMRKITNDNAHANVKQIHCVLRDNNDYSYVFKSKNQCAKFFGVSASLVYQASNHTIKFLNTELGHFDVKLFEQSDARPTTKYIMIPHGRAGKTYNKD